LRIPEGLCVRVRLRAEDASDCSPVREE